MKKNVTMVLLTFVLIIIIGAIFAGQKLMEKYSYGTDRADLQAYYGISSEDEVPIILQDEQLEKSARLIDGTCYLDLDSVHAWLNRRFYAGMEDQILVYTTPTAILTAHFGDNAWSGSDGSSGTEDYQIARLSDDGETLYVALDYVKKYTNFSYTLFENPNRIQMYTSWPERQIASVSKDTQLRLRGGIKSEILEDLPKGTKVYVLEELEDWMKVRSQDALVGYVEKKRLGSVTTETPIAVTDYQEPEYTHVTRDYKINMGWHQLGGYAGNDTLGSMTANTKGLNVISPTWFWVGDNSGNLVSIASSDYVAKAHGMGLEVWALVRNFGVEGVDTGAILSHAASRATMISQLMDQASQQGIEGINVDFEQVPQANGQDFIEFIREMSVACRARGLVLSVDNYVPMGFNDYYDREEQGIVADYVVIMGYDEHYAGSDTAGSVASLGYVTSGIENTVSEVPSERVINGIPFYTRVWTTTGSEVTSEAVDMQTAKQFVSSHNIELHWDDAAGQYYGEYTDGNGALRQVWLEEAESIHAKLGVMEANHLGGVAEWRLGLETADVWDEIAAYCANGK